MLRSNRRGAARVSAVWMISVGVVALAALAFGFISQSDMKKQQEAAEAARAEAAAAQERVVEANEKRRNVSEVLGWYDRAGADPSADVELAKRQLADLAATFPGHVADGDEDFETVIPKVVEAYSARGSKIATLETRVKTLEDELAAKDAAIRDITSQKDETIADLRQQLADQQQNAETRQKELEDRIASVSQDLADRDAQLRASRAEMVDLQSTFDAERRVQEAVVMNLRDKLAFTEEGFVDLPDGKILDVSQRTDVAWIDIGANQRLARGMRFRIEGGIAGRRVEKGWGEVTKVDANRAQMLITEVADPYNYVQPGDVIVNPLYDPQGTRVAVLAGSFSEFSRTELVGLLGRMGIEVQEEVDPNTDFLIVGGTVYNDPQTNEPLAEPMPVSELAVYKDAESLQVQILPLKDVRRFFRFGQGESVSSR